MQEKLISFKLKIIYTVSLNFCYFIYGIGSNLSGLTLIDMANLLKVGLNAISCGLSIRSIFYSIGSLLCILVLNKFNRQFQLALSFIFLGISLTLSPCSRNLTQYFIWKAVAGLCCSTIDIVCFVWMLEIWKEDNHRHMQSLNFFYSLGNILAPIIILPFLSAENQILKDTYKNLNETVTNLSFQSQILKISNDLYSLQKKQNDTLDVLSYRLSLQTQTQIHIPYAIIGLVIFLTGVVMNLLYLFIPYEEFKDKKNENLLYSVTNKQKSSKFTFSNFYFWTILLLSCSISCFYFAMIINNQDYIQAFGIASEFKLNKTTASYLNLTYSSVLTFSCLCFVLITSKFSPKIIIITDLFLMVISNCILIFFCDSQVEKLWIAIILLGIGMSSIYPSLFSYMKQKIDVNNNVGCFIVFTGSIISIFYPIIEGKYIETFPLTFPLINMFSLIVMIVLFSILLIFDIVYNSRQKSQKIFNENIYFEDNFDQEAYKNTLFT